MKLSTHRYMISRFIHNINMYNAILGINNYFSRCNINIQKYNFQTVTKLPNLL